MPASASAGHRGLCFAHPSPPQTAGGRWPSPRVAWQRRPRNKRSLRSDQCQRRAFTTPAKYLIGTSRRQSSTSRGIKDLIPDRHDIWSVEEHERPLCSSAWHARLKRKNTRQTRQRFTVCGVEADWSQRTTRARAQAGYARTQIQIQKKGNV